MSKAVQEKVRDWMSAYRRHPALRLGLLLDITEALTTADDPAAVMRGAGITRDWLREQGELVSRAGTGDNPGSGLSSCHSARELFLLRRAFTALGVPAGGWAVDESGIAAALLARARHDLAWAMEHDDPDNGWDVFTMHADGFLPDLDDLGPGGRDAVTRYAVRHVRESIDGKDDWRASSVLAKLRELLPHLDAGFVTALRDAGIPVDEDGLGHAEHRCDVRNSWQMYLDGPDDERSHIFLTVACQAILGRKTLEARDLGTTEEEIWGRARGWVGSQVQLIRAGSYAPVHDLTWFLRGSGLGPDPFGLSEDQVRVWEEARARDSWAGALSGDGRAAFSVLGYCAGNDGSSWERVTGLPEDQARARLQAAMEAYAAGLRKKAETAGSPGKARPYGRELLNFMAAVRAANEHFREPENGGKPLVNATWEPSSEEWRAFCDRYLRDGDDNS